MKVKIVMILLLSLVVMSCQKRARDSHDAHEVHSGHEEHDDGKLLYTVYDKNIELFAEADPFVNGEPATIIAHFTQLPGFKPIENVTVKASLVVYGKEVSQTIKATYRKGIYVFVLLPETEGEGVLNFEITSSDSTYVIEVPKVKVFSAHWEAHLEVEKNEISQTNTVVFTKEQSWKTKFATAYPVKEKFGEVIKTTAIIQSTQGGEIIISAKTDGIVKFLSDELLEGISVRSGQALFTISGNDMADNNFNVRFLEAKNNYEKAKADFERSEKLLDNKIVSDKEFLVVKNKYDNAKAVYDNLRKNFLGSGQIVSSTINGYVHEVLVKNGMYVQAGQALMHIVQNNNLVLCADVSPKHLKALGKIYSATIRNIQGDKTYTLEELNGRVMSYGKVGNASNYLLPVHLQISNPGEFAAGGFVDLYIKTKGAQEVVIVDNTALIEEQGNYFVFVQLTPELFEKRQVFIGESDGLKTEIREGLSIEERVVTQGAILIKLSQSSGALDAHSGHVH